MSARPGFTLLELLIAMILLAIVMLGAGAMTDTLIRTVVADEMEATAMQLAEDRLQAVLLDPAFAELEARHEWVEEPVDSAPAFRRETIMDRVVEAMEGGGRVEYVRVTVRVSGPRLPEPVARTAAVGAP